MYKINLILGLKERAQRNQEFLGASRKAGLSPKRMILSELIEQSLRKSIKSPIFAKLNADKKVDTLIDFLNKNTNVEYAHVVYKATIGRDFDSFVRSEAKTIRGLSIVFRIKDNKNEYLKHNSVIFEVDLTKITPSQGVAFKLTNILTMNLPISAHGISRGIKTITMPFNIKTDIDKMQESDLIWMKGLVKPIDLYGDDTNLRIGDWRTVTERFKEYNDSRKNLTVPLFAIEDSLQIKRKTNVKFISFIPNELTLNPNTRYFINNSDDSSLKGKLKFLKMKESIDGEFKDRIRDEIKFLAESKETLVIKIGKDNEKQQSLSVKLVNLNEEKEAADNNINILDSKIHKYNLGLTQYKKDFEVKLLKKNNKIEVYKKQIERIKYDEKELIRSKDSLVSINKKLEKEILKLSLNGKKDSKEVISNRKNKILINRKSISDNNLDILKIKNMMPEFEASIKKENSSIKIIETNFKGEIITFNEEKSSIEKLIKNETTKKDKHTSEAKKLNKDINNIETSIKKIERNIQEYNNLFTKANQEIESWENAILTIDDLRKKYIIAEVHGIADIDDRSKKTLSINKFSFDSFIKEPNRYIKNAKWLMSDYDLGFATVIWRNNTAMRNLSFGNYKSPYLAIDLNNPSIGLAITNKETKGKLNTKQKEAFQMITNSYQSSFLQGPPGTGKTQVISNVISYYANNGEISLISSSTNEAINNAIERIDRDEKNNPNIIFLRASNDRSQREKAKKFLEESIPTNFINKMINSALDSGDNNRLANDIVSTYKKEDINTYFSKIFIEKFLNEETVNSNIDLFAGLIGQTVLEGEDKKYFWEDNEQRLRRKISKSASSKKMGSDIEEFFSKHEDKVIDPTISTFDFINAFVSTKNKSLLETLVSKIQMNVSSNGIDKELDSEIISKVDKENLINIIGITTTSKPVVNINGKQRELFLDYPIDFSVVDEVSKSITPEIIQISSLSSKFLYAGDYRQLPPASDISSEYISEFFKWSTAQVEHRHFNGLLRTNGIKDAEQFEEFLKGLYENTLFKNQVVKLKRKEGKKSYTALREQYRFTEEIAELVNIVYEENEKLTTFKHKQGHFKYYEIDGVETKHSTVIIDTSYISQDYVEFAQANNARYIPTTNELAFDQKETIIGRKMNYNSLFNQYNAFVGIDAIMKLKKNNSKLLPEDIGYICMTRSQVNVVKELMNLKPNGVQWDIDWLMKIKVDTVDNFQGREKEVVFVDLVRAQNAFREGATEPSQTSKRELSFYSRNERLNVAVSRAKSKLILLGAIEQHLGPNVSSTVEKNGVKQNVKIFERFLELVEAKGEVIKRWI